MYQDIAIKKFKEIRSSGQDITVLGIESSCDETAAAVVKNGRTVLSNIISTQVEIHKRFGGVVPEVASRNHTLAINEVVSAAIKEAGVSFEDIDAIAVTYGAGLIGALLVGVSTAKALAYALEKPLIAVNHLEAHILANLIEFKDLEPPFTALVVSGGHTGIVDVNGYNDYSLVGGTADDAAGEAFDKVARLLGLGYPGGPAVDAMAKKGTASFSFYKKKQRVDPDLKLSYSGLKTAVVNHVHNARQKGAELNIPDICAAFTADALDILCDTAAVRAVKTGTLVVAGGVAANSYLRNRMEEVGKKEGFRVYFPSSVLCTDNAAMVACRGYYSILEGKNLADLTLTPVASLKVGV